MSAASRLRNLTRPLRHTPLHPQWLVFRGQALNQRDVATGSHGLVLDIGCGDRWAASMLPPGCTYVGLDYPTTVSKGYPGHPDVFGDAQKQPFRSSSFDTVLMMDVLEHLPTPDQAISEICRSLKSGGRLILQVPFLYPLHDEPYDFHRWTVHGLHQLCSTHGLKIESETSHGQPCETAAALLAIAIAKGIVDSLSNKKIALLLTPLMLPIIPIVNLMGWLLAKALPGSGMMPMSYRLTAIKPE